MSKQSSDEPDPESEPEAKEDKLESSEKPSVSHETPPHGNETEEQSQNKPDTEGDAEATVYTEQDLTEEGRKALNSFY